MNGLKRACLQLEVYSAPEPASVLRPTQRDLPHARGRSLDRRSGHARAASAGDHAVRKVAIEWQVMDAAAFRGDTPERLTWAQNEHRTQVEADLGGSSGLVGARSLHP